MNSRLVLLGGSLVVLLAVGCGGLPFDDEDGGVDAGFSIAPGTYAFSAATNLTDGCNQDPNNVSNTPGVKPLAETTIEVTNNNGFLGIGDKTGTPPQPSQGEGQIVGNSGTLIRDNDVSTQNGTCTFHRRVDNVVTLTANNAMTVNHSRTDSNHSAGCSTSATCTTTFTYSLTKKP